MSEYEKIPVDDECDALIRVLDRRQRKLRRRLKGPHQTPESARAQEFQTQVLRQLFFVRYADPAEGQKVEDIARGLRSDV